MISLTLVNYKTPIDACLQNLPVYTSVEKVYYGKLRPVKIGLVGFPDANKLFIGPIVRQLAVEIIIRRSVIISVQ